LGTGREQKITITSSSGLSKEEVQNMTKEGELHAEEDKRRKEEVEVKNRADSMVYSVEKLLKENREKIAESDAKNIEAALEEAKKAIQEGDVSKINSTVEKLTTASHKLAEAMYKQAAPPQPAAPAGAADAQAGPTEGGAKDKAKGEGEVIDAEVVDDDKKKS
jgi:molecular chaperone DnaK